MNSFMRRIMLSVSIRIYSFCFSAVRLVFSRIPSLNARYAVSEHTRLPPAHRDFRGHTVVWLHAASLGESKVLVDFLRMIHARHPDYLFVVTATSVSGTRFLRECRHDAICAAGCMPIDTITFMNEMLARFNISRLWLVETELWPSMLWVCMNRSVPAGIVNARLEQKSYNMYRRLGFVFKPLICTLDPVLVQDETYSRRFSALGIDPSRITVIGNIKSLVAVKRPEYEEWKKLRQHMNLSEDRVVITAGCIHAGEGRTIRCAIDQLSRSHVDWQWIVVPRYLDDIEELMDTLGSDAILVKEPFVTKEWRICVIGAYGILENQYRIADAAVVGGTFVDVGGHNMWEAAQFGIPVIWGPHFYEQRESCERLMESGVGFEAGGGDELAHTLVRVLKTDARQFIKAQSDFIARHKQDTESLERLIP
jgi:3-deoxy-D-manno-octulosonic-acid transferase